MISPKDLLARTDPCPLPERTGFSCPLLLPNMGNGDKPTSSLTVSLTACAHRNCPWCSYNYQQEKDSKDMQAHREEQQDHRENMQTWGTAEREFQVEKGNTL